VSNIAATLRSARERRGWSREALAYHSGVSFSGITQIESGRRTDVRLGSLLALAGALSVSVDYLVGAAPTPPPLFEHLALFYESDEDLLAAVTTFFSEGTGSSEVLLVLTTEPRIRLLRDTLGATAGEIAYVASSSWWHSPMELLQNLRSFLNERLEAGASWARIVSDPPWTGLASAEVAAWIRFESILNLVFAGAPLTFGCAYNARSTPRRVLLGAQRTHPEIVRSDGSGESSQYRAPEDYLIAYPAR